MIGYGKLGAATGPTLSGCRLEEGDAGHGGTDGGGGSGGGGGGVVTLVFNTTLLGTDSVSVVPGAWQTWPNASKVHVLTDPKLFCMQTTGQGATAECTE